MSASLETNPFRRAAAVVLATSHTGSSAISSSTQSSASPASVSQQSAAPRLNAATTSSYPRMDPRLEIPEDSPPPYTPSPSSREGEQTLEFGPNRPFQPPPPAQPIHFISQRPTGLIPPPAHPSIQRPISTGVDFYNSGRQSWPAHHGAPPTSSSAEHLPSSAFAPPPGPPPRGALEVDPEAAHQPTVQPTPGHPLLRDGNTLIYPQGYSCHKCNNTGFKSYDPSHPCRKCWDKYAKPYRGAVTYAPNSGSAGNFQRPLPAFQGPPQQHYGNGGGYPGSLSRSSTWGGPRPTGPVYGAGSGFGGPPPGALVVKPGDPRIGGRLCWRCGGAGEVPLMIFDSETCPTCRGTGRVFS